MRTEPKTRDAGAPRPRVLICGMVHFASRADRISTDVGDVTGSARSREIADVVHRLARYEPSHVAVEVPRTRDGELNARYREFLAGSYEPGANEVEQLGFRIAARVGHERLHPIDWMGTIAGQRGYGEVLEWAAENQPDIYRELTAEPAGTRSAVKESLLDLLRGANRPEGDARSQAAYLRFAQIGAADEYVGLDWLMWWYRRNLILYVNITRLAEAPGSRVLVLIGGGHRFLLRQFLEDSGRFAIEDVDAYLA